MPYYYANINADEKGLNEVHTSTCAWLPSESNRATIGQYDNCRLAIAAMKQANPSHKFDGCKHCSPSCHTG